MGGLVLHAVAFADGDDAIVSSGPSESGKSTLARMLRGAFEVYSDEMNVVTSDGRVWGLPFRGTGVEKARAGGGRLAAMTFHRPGDDFASSALDEAEAARNLWPNVFVPEGADAELKLAAFERVSALAGRAPAYTVEVPLDEDATREGFRKVLKTSLKDGGHETYVRKTLY
jgi:energy-coupling factor transporter ATP-binding protein EcfA2